MGGTGDAIIAVFACLLGGVWNSTWPLFSKFESPKLIRAVSPGGWEWENVWFLFSLWYAALNILYCISAIGPSTLDEIYRSASGGDLALVCIFSFLWGSGTMFYSIGVEMLGAAIGICLVMSLLVVIGTLLPLIEDHQDDAGSAPALITIGGMVLAISGFISSAYSSKIKEEALKSTADTKNVAAHDTEGGVAVVTVADLRSSVASNGEGGGGGDGQAYGEAQGVKGADQHVSNEGGRGGRGGGVPGRHSYGVGVAVCIAGAVMSSMLQFAFVYGERCLLH
ncbi:unnamed protein product [Choristocarpus tenellus]